MKSLSVNNPIILHSETSFEKSEMKENIFLNNLAKRFLKNVVAKEKKKIAIITNEKIVLLPVKKYNFIR